MKYKMRRGDHIVLTVMIIGVLASSLYYWYAGRVSGDLTAVVKLDGKEIRRINLSMVTGPNEFAVYSGPTGSQYDIIEVDRGRIRVREANCPEQIVVRQGWISRPGQSAICLPHRLVLQILSDKPSEVDAVSA